MKRRWQRHTRILVTRRRGFALVVTLSLMILLTIIAVGLLSLASVSLRTTSQTEARAIARANARLSLMLAIGELQRNAGPDTRVTARADILAKENPPVLGVWESWQGTDHETQGAFAGRPVSPGSDYRAAKTTRFRAWLTSVSTSSSSTVSAVPNTSAAADKAKLVGEGSVGKQTGNANQQVYLTPTLVSRANQQGGFAWWVAGENQKARLPRPYNPDADIAARWAVRAKSHAIADTTPFRMNALLTTPAPADKAITRAEADFIATPATLKASNEFFHDLSTVSSGLLTNTATGGWRKDISLLTETWDSQPTSGLSFFRLTPTTEISDYTRPSQGSPVIARSMLYPWASYRGGTNIPIYQHGPVTSWANLADYATLYKRINESANGQMSTSTYSVAIDNSADSFGFLHKVRILPVIARMQWVFSHSAAVVADPNKLEARLLLTPVITMWNPYNVEITAPVLTFQIPKPLPAALRYTINGATNVNYNALTTGNTNNNPTLSGAGSLNFSIPATFTLKPGETRLFSPASTTPVAATATINLAVGYRSGGGHYFQVKDDAGNVVTAPRNAAIKADAKFDTQYHDGAVVDALGVGIYLDMKIGVARHLVYRMVYIPEVANTIYKPLTNLAAGTLSQSLTNPQPFLSTIFGARMASRTHLAAKGFVQSSPLVNYTAMGRKDEAETTISRHYGGTAHPVNSPFDYSFVKHAPGGDSLLPNASDTTGSGYIVTGFNKSDGLSRCVIDELPFRPLVSLGELVNWDVRYENPIPPYAFNLTGNSDATPLLPSNAVVNSADAGLTVNLQHDDSYCINHLLFDDWFVSSVTPDPSDFGSASRNAQDTFVDFVAGRKPLPNHDYLPIQEDKTKAATGDAAARQLYTDKVSKTDAWRTIASRFEVDGMFNVNSTSVTAWRALLGHARNQRVPYIRDNGASWMVDLSAKSDHVLSRFSISGDTVAGTPGISGAFPEATEFAGYRKVDEKFLDALALQVVSQVRARGPFLSLAEFVNRQLSSGDLALAGTLQAALNEVTKSPATNPLASVQALSTVSLAVPDRAAEAEYKFPDAAAGYSGYGLPGWTRQADILRPLAPVLSARDDTFTIRAYGDCRDSSNRIVATAWCEAVVRRDREYVNPTDAADIVTAPTISINQKLGRRFKLVSFRWLNANEV